MISRRRPAACFLLLFLALLTVAPVSAGDCAEDCRSSCAADCGGCVLCAPSGTFVGLASTPALPSEALGPAARVTPAKPIDYRAIEHVPRRIGF